MNELAARLVELEQKYGGGTHYLPWGRFSPHHDTPKGNLRGGDRMKHHGYAPAYAEELVALQPKVIVELGILKGSGLAVWCDLYPEARVIGLDIDAGPFERNRAELERRGAFTQNEPEVHEFDELSQDAGQALAGILDGAEIDVFVDDALHYDAAILWTLGHALERLSAGGVYFIEDNGRIYEALKALLPEHTVKSRGLLTIIRSKHDGC